MISYHYLLVDGNVEAVSSEPTAFTSRGQELARQGKTAIVLKALGCWKPTYSAEWEPTS